MAPESGLIMMGAIFAGAMWGGSVSAILINTPGTPGAAATVLDGYPMAQKGQAGEALGYAIMSSVLGGLFSIAASLGSTESLVVPPALQQPRGMSEEQRAWTGITPGTVRLSIGIEDPDDLIDDLRRALAGTRG